ncbi:MAG: cytochrome c oxidase subunit 3 [Planctomycetota bacterium]
MAQAMLPTDLRHRQGGWLFIGMLLVFFLSSLLLYAIYAATRVDDIQSRVPLPSSFLYSTICLLFISVLVHASTRAVRRSRRFQTTTLLSTSAIAAILFMAIQYESMIHMLGGPALSGGTGKGLAGMIAVLAFLHALHVAGGIVALGIVSVRSGLGRYDHERHWPVDFAAHYWHFLDIIWICMLGCFVWTTGGFA